MTSHGMGAAQQMGGLLPGCSQITPSFVLYVFVSNVKAFTQARQLAKRPISPLRMTNTDKKAAKRLAGTTLAEPETG